MKGADFIHGYAEARLRRVFPSAEICTHLLPASNDYLVQVRVSLREAMRCCVDPEEGFRSIEARLAPRMPARRRHWSLLRHGGRQ